MITQDQNRTKVLIIEDVEEDALRIVNELYRGGYDPRDKRVSTEISMRQALKDEEWDLIISDFNLPEFSGPEALNIYMEMELDIPFIMVSGTVGEEAAIDSLLAGAHDFVTKNNFSRLLPAINRELRESKIRSEHKQAQEKIKSQSKFLQDVVDAFSYPLYVINVEDYSIAMINSAAQSLSKEKITTCYALSHKRSEPCDSKDHPCPLEIVKKSHTRTTVEHIHYDIDGNERNVEVHAFPIFDDNGKLFQVIESSIDITEKKKIEERVRTYADVVSNMQVGLHVYQLEHIDDDRTLRMIATNPAASLFTGTSVDDVLGKTIDEIFPELREKGIPNIYADVIRTGEKRDIEDVSFLSNSVITRAYSVKIFPLPNNCVGVAFENITERKQAESALTESQLKYKSLFDSSADAIMMLKPGEGFIAGNPKAIEIFGCKDEDEFTSLGPADMSPEYQPDGLLSEEEAQKMIGKAVEEGSNYFEWKHQRLNGDLFDATVLLKSFQLGNEKVIQATVRDISQRKKAEEELLRSEQTLRTITETAMDAIIMINHEGKTTFWNPAAEKIFGYTQEEIIGKNLHELIAPDDLLKLHNQAFPDFVKTGTGNAIGKSLVLSGKRKDGKVISIELTISRIKIDDRWNAMGIVRDISERNQLEVQLRQSQKMESIGTLASGIAHEINTPTQYVGNNIKFFEDSFDELKEILEAVNILKQEENETDLCDKLKEIHKLIEDADLEYLFEEIPKAIEEAKRGITNVTRIVSAMRSFAHPGAKEKKMTNIHNALENTITISRNEWKYDAELFTKFDPEVPLVPCYVSEFNQVILNMIVNAAHAIRELAETKKDRKTVEIENGSYKGKIEIATKKYDNFVEIVISDNGTGIPKEVQDRVFEPFFTTKDVGQGTGQGLTLAYNVIVEQHGGELFLESESGENTKFHVRLPLN